MQGAMTATCFNVPQHRLDNNSLSRARAWRSSGYCCLTTKNTPMLNEHLSGFPERWYSCSKLGAIMPAYETFTGASDLC